MPRQIKVWCGNYDGKNEAIVAASTKKRAASLLGVSMYEFNMWYVETDYDEYVKQAVKNPGVVFKRQMLAPRGTLWTEVKKGSA